ncbi:hypothetical protein SH449x_003978 [Pirellulaceae bacterium SH449]
MRLKSRLCIASCGLIMILGASNVSYGQLPNQGKSSLLNYFGRFHGIGFSDGYHSCPDQQCGQGRSRVATAGFSTFYGEPTAPPPSRFQRPEPSYTQHSNGYASAYPHSTHSHDFSASHSSAIPNYSILLQDEQPVISQPRPQMQPMVIPRGQFEPIPAPIPDRSMDQTKRAIPGTTRPYHANGTGQPTRR